MASGNTIELEGVGLVGRELTLQVNGHAVGSFSVRTVVDSDNASTAQQLVTLVVPDGVTLAAGNVITVSTNGGTDSLRTNVALADQAGVTPPATSAIRWSRR